VPDMSRYVPSLTLPSAGLVMTGEFGRGVETDSARSGGVGAPGAIGSLSMAASFVYFLPRECLAKAGGGRVRPYHSVIRSCLSDLMVVFMSDRVNARAIQHRHFNMMAESLGALRRLPCLEGVRKSEVWRTG
jgi:hypothetical protein